MGCGCRMAGLVSPSLNYISSTCVRVCADTLRFANEIFIQMKNKKRLWRACFLASLFLALASFFPIGGPMRKGMRRIWQKQDHTAHGVYRNAHAVYCYTVHPTPNGGQYHTSFFVSIQIHFNFLSVGRNSFAHTGGWIRHLKPRAFYVCRVRDACEFAASVFSFLCFRILDFAKLGIKYFVQDVESVYFAENVIQWLWRRISNDDDDDSDGVASRCQNSNSVLWQSDCCVCTTHTHSV